MDGGCYRISHRDAILFGGRDGRSAADAYDRTPSHQVAHGVDHAVMLE